MEIRLFEVERDDPRGNAEDSLSFWIRAYTDVEAAQLWWNENQELLTEEEETILVVEVPTLEGPIGVASGTHFARFRVSSKTLRSADDTE